MIAVRAPGRVNLIGDHTDYTGGLVLPMAIDRWTEVRGTPSPDGVRLRSAQEPEPAVVPLDVSEPAAVVPPWARYVAGVVAEVRPDHGLEGTVTTTIPIGAGLSSSAALEVAVALALGMRGTALELALVCQRAEHRASGVPCGIMDQLASAAGVEGSALLIDCSDLSIGTVPIPDGVDIVVVDSHEPRALAASAYAARVEECARAAAVIGPLRSATPEAVEAIADPIARKRARHVVTENQRVRDFVDALRSGSLDGAGELMRLSHVSLRDDYEVSTPTIDTMVAALCSVEGVFGARLTGAGFGGCVVVLARRGALVDVGWVVRATSGAAVIEG